MTDSSSSHKPGYVYELTVWCNYLYGAGMWIMKFNHGRIAAVERHLDPHQRFYSIRIRSSRPKDIISKRPGTCMYVQSIFHHPLLPTQKYYIKCRISPRRYYLKKEKKINIIIIIKRLFLFFLIYKWPVIDNTAPE